MRCLSRFLMLAAIAIAQLAPLAAAAATFSAIRNSVVSPPLASRSLYTIDGLGMLAGYQQLYPAAINDSDSVVARLCCGAAQQYPLDTAAAIFHAGQLTNLGVLKGFLASTVSAVNDAGLAVGTSAQVPLPGSFMLDHTRAVAFTHAGVVDLGALPGYPESAASGVNAYGDAIGYSQSASNMSVTLFRHGSAIRLGDGWGTGINNADIAVGTALNGVATLFSVHGTRALGTFVARSAYSYGTAINNRGVAIGYSGYPTGQFPGSFQHAFVTAGDGLHDLGVPAGDVFLTTQSIAYGINDLNEIVGYYLPGAGPGIIAIPGPPTAFIYSNGVMRDLNDVLPSGSGWTLESADAINNCGDIVGEGLFHGQEQGYILRPRQLDQPRLRAAAGCRR